MFCSESAREAGEGISGSAAADTSVWLLVEAPMPWAAQPLESDTIPRSVARALEAFTARIPGARLQLIRSSDNDSATVRVILGSSKQRDAWLRRHDFPTLMALEDFDLGGAYADRTGVPIEEPLYLVCTHGRRDRCCAKWGSALFRALAPLAPDRVLQTSHLGGHRFAATALVLPAGMCYGWLRSDDAGGLFEATQAGRIHRLDAARGRTELPAPAQAAEILLREELGLSGLADLELVSQTGLGPDRWRVFFRAADGAEHSIEVAKHETGQSRYSSCTDKAPGAATKFVAV